MSNFKSKHDYCVLKIKKMQKHDFKKHIIYRYVHMYTLYTNTYIK